MWWFGDLTVIKGTVRSTAVELDANLTLGTLERAIVLFPPGCLGFVHVTFWRFEHQFLPEAAKGSILGDDYVFDVPCDYEISEIPPVITVRAWNTANTYDHTITIGLFVRKEGVDRIKNALRALFVGGG